MKIVRGLAVSLFACVACGGEAPQQQVVTPPPLHITAAPPPPERARWTFQHPERGLVGKLDLGDGRILYIGQNGRRELAKGTDPLVDAPTLALSDLVGVVRDDKGQYAFLAADGTVLVSKDPLGTLDVVRPGPVGPEKPNARLSSPTTGKSALMGIHPDGRVMRSSNFGQTWTAVDYAGANKPYGHAANVVLDSKGNGVLLHFPQRLYITHDDGATWAPLASNHMGVRSITRDGADRIFAAIYGSAKAKLDGNALVPTTELPKPVYVPPPSDTPVATASTNNERTDSKSILTGERVVELVEITRHGKVREIEIGSAALGEKADKPVTNTDLVGASGLSKHIAGHGRELVYLRDDDDAEEAAPTTTVYRSKDYGATWQKESQLQGVEAAEGEGVDVAAGPKGWVFVTSLCPKDEPSSTSCAHRQIRPAGATAFEDMAFVEEFAPMSFAFDEAHDKVYAIGLREGRQYVYESPLDQNKFSRTKLLDATSYAKTALTVDAKGTARALEWDSGKSTWVLHRRDQAGKDQPPLYLALDRGTIALNGVRGVLFGSAKGYETNDGGETWARVATNGYARSLECSDAGCINGDAHRIGWDLPALKEAEKITATTEPTPPTTTPDAPRPPAITPTEVTCKVTGTATSISSNPGTDMVDGTAADRWASVKHDTDSKISIVVGTKNAVRELPLLAALPKPTANAANASAEELRSGERVLSDGVVAARYRFAPRSSSGSYNPVDVELAWWSATTGRTQHKTLPKVAPFRVSRYGFSGTPQIVTGGMLFQGGSSDPVYFIHDDGKVESITIPKGASVREAERLPKRWVLADSEGGAAQISLSDDNAKTWQKTAWGLDNWGSVSLTSVGDKATLSFGSGSLPALLFSIDQTLPDDPPVPIVIDVASVDNACDAHAGRHRFTSYIQSDRRPVRVRIEEGKGKDTWATTFSPGTRVMHDTQSGKMCTSAYVMSGYDTHSYQSQTAFLYPEANGGYSGWRFRRPEDRSKPGTLAEQLTCK